MDLIQEIDRCTTALIEARQRLALLHDQICDAAKSGAIKIEDNIVDASIWNNYGHVLIGAGMFSDAEQIYRDMLETIRAAEKEKGQLHKGLPLYNMGLAQFLQGNFDQAIPNILEAYEEDVKRLGADEARERLASRFKQDLYALVAREIDTRFLAEIKMSGLRLRRVSSADLVQELSESEFLFFGRIVLSNAHVRFREDMYTRVVLFDNLKNLCLLLEVFLKQKTGVDDNVGPLLRLFFQGESWLGIYSAHARTRTQFKASTVKDALRKFEANLKFLDGNLGGTRREQFLARAFLTTVLVRHFTSHYFDAYDDLVKNEAVYNQIFERAMCSILYSLDESLGRTRSLRPAETSKERGPP